METLERDATAAAAAGRAALDTFRTTVQPQLPVGTADLYVVINVRTGQYELDTNAVAAAQRMQPEPTWPGREVYRAKVRPLLSKADRGKYVVLDIKTGEYELDANEVVASRRLRTRVPAAELWSEYVGYLAHGSFGGPIPEDPLP